MRLFLASRSPQGVRAFEFRGGEEVTSEEAALQPDLEQGIGQHAPPDYPLEVKTLQPSGTRTRTRMRREKDERHRKASDSGEKNLNEGGSAYFMYKYHIRSTVGQDRGVDGYVEAREQEGEHVC